MEQFNGTLSYSKLKRYEQCPQSYYRHYVLKETSVPNDSLIFGGLMHSVLETFYCQKQTEGYTGPIDYQELLTIFKRLWIDAGLASQELFEDGISILQNYVEHNPTFDAKRILALEKEFELPIDIFKVIGFIDRIEQINSDTIAIIDYKTNRTIFSREEVDRDLQLSIYQLAVKSLYPEIANIHQEFYLLRHNIRMATHRSEADLETAKQYIHTLGLQIEGAKEFPAKLNSNCPYCDHKSGCEEYRKALAGETPLPEIDTKNLEAVAALREQAASIAKIAYAKKTEMEEIIKVHLQHNQTLALGSKEYSMSSTTKITYPIDKTLGFLSQMSGLPQAELYQKFGEIDKDKVEAYVKSLRKGRTLSEYAQIKAQLEDLADKSYSPRFCARNKHGEE